MGAFDWARKFGVDQKRKPASAIAAMASRASPLMNHSELGDARISHEGLEAQDTSRCTREKFSAITFHHTTPESIVNKRLTGGGTGCRGEPFPLGAPWLIDVDSGYRPSQAEYRDSPKSVAPDWPGWRKASHLNRVGKLFAG
jgi:hypothetical protein